MKFRIIAPIITGLAAIFYRSKSKKKNEKMKN